MNQPFIYNDHKDRRPVHTHTIGEVLAGFQRGTHYGEEGANRDIKEHGPRNEQAVRDALAVLDQILASHDYEPWDKFMSVCAAMGYLSKQYDGWCRIHIPMIVTTRA